MDPALLTACCGASQLFALGRIATLKLFRQYPWFAAYLATGIAQVAILSFIPYKTPEYFALYTLSACILMPLRFAVAFESWRLTMSSYPRIGSAARSIAFWSAAAGLVVAALFGLDGFTFQGPTSHALLIALSLLIRYSACVLTVLCATLWIVTSILKLGVRPNARTHVGILTGYFLTIAAQFLLINRYGVPIRHWLDPLAALSFVALWLAWSARMTLAGEQVDDTRTIADERMIEELPDIVNVVTRGEMPKSQRERAQEWRACFSLDQASPELEPSATPTGATTPTSEGWLAALRMRASMHLQRILRA